MLNKNSNYENDPLASDASVPRMYVVGKQFPYHTEEN